MKRKFSHLIAHYLPQCLLLISILTSNVLFPATVIAQEIENTNNVTQEETVPIDTSEDILEEGISTSIYEEEEVVEPLFVFENGIYTVKNVVQGEEYVYPDNNNVRVKFTEVTQEGNLVIKRVELTEEQKELLNTKDSYGWDITSSMENGTFKYNLTLPNTQGNEDIEVKYTEDNNTYESIDNSNVEINSNVVTIEGLDHFTLFVVTKTLPTGVSNGEVCTVASIEGVCYNTIQGAINAAQSNGETEQDVINIRNGTYKECLSISGKNIQLLGESKAGVIIDNTSCSSYGIHVNGANQIIFKNMTVNGAPSSYTFKIANSTYIELRQINVNNSYLTGIDLNGVNEAFINNVKVVNTIRGFGLMIKDSNNVKVQNVTTSGNAWGGVSVQTAGDSYTGGVDNVAFTGNFNVSEIVPLLLEKDYPGYYDITNVTIPDKFNYIVYTLRSDNYKQWFYVESLENVKQFANGLMNLSSNPYSYSDILIYDIAEENYWVIPGMSIQDAIDASTNNDVIYITEGSYNEQLSVVGKDLVLNGDGKDKTFINSPDTLSTLYTTSGPNKPIIYVNNSNSTIQNLTVDGLGKGNANYRMQGISYYNAGGIVNNVEIKNVKDTPASGAQHGVGLYVYIDDTETRLVDVNNVSIHDYQKNGTVFAGEGLTANISNSIIYGLGKIDFIAQNGIQYSSGATGKAEGNDVSGNYYTPQTWAATGFLLNDAGKDLKIVDNNVHENGWGGIYVYMTKSNLEISDNHVYNNLGDGIILSGADMENAKVFNNIVENNDNGIWIDSNIPDNLVVYNNTFSNTVNAGDDGGHYFDNGTIGNFWSDYDGLDLDGDGIGDTKDYIIDPNSSDRYPLTEDYLSVHVLTVETNKDYYKEGDMLSIKVEIKNNGLMTFDPTKEKLVVNITDPNNSYISGAFRGVHTLSLQPGETETVNFYVNPQTIPSGWIEGNYKVYVSVYSTRVPLGYLTGGQNSDTTFIVDNTPPTKPTGLQRKNGSGETFACGSTAQRQAMIPVWDDITTNDPSFSHFEYSSFNADGSQGKDEMILYTSEFESGWVAPVDGTYGYTVRSVDKAGNKSAWAYGGETLEDSCKITYDSIGPVVTLTSPKDNYYTNRTSVRQEWTTTTTDVDRYEYRSCKNNPSADGVCTPIYSETTENQYRTVHNNNISFWWQVRGIDNVGNEGAWSEARKITIDTIAPDAPEIEYPSPESYFNSSPIRNEWTEVSDSSGIAFYRVWYVYDDGHTFSGGPYRTTTSTFRNHTPDIGEQGGVTISVQAVDNAGNESEWSNSIHYTYDETPPTTPTNGAPNGTYITTNDFYFTWSASNDKSPLIYEFQSSSSNAVDKNGSLINAWNSIRDGNSEQKNLTAPTIHSTGADDGLYYWQVRAIDAAGNYSNWSDIWTVTIDTTAPSKPVITNTPDNAFTNINAITVNWEGGDDKGTNPSGIKGYIIRYVFTSANENTVTDWTSGLVEVGNPNTRTGIFGDGEGKYVMYVRTQDNAGNLSPESEPYTITYDSTPPVITLDTYNTDWTNGDFTVNASTNEGSLNYYSHIFTENGSFDFIATDRAGNSTTKTVTITNIDKTNPTVDSISISNGFLTVASTDTPSGVKSVEVKINADGAWTPYTTNMNLNTMLNNTPGTYTIYVRVTDKAGNTTEGSTTYTIPQPAPTQIPATTGGAVLGATTTTTTTKTTKGITKTTSPISTTQTEEILETTSIEEPSVLGERCENKKKVSGYVYIDENKDKEMNENEEGIKDITLTIQYTDEEGNIKTEEEVNTDENGYWETQLCSGKYNIVVKEDTLPKNIEVSEVLSLTVSDNEEETIFNIQALDTRNFWQKYWYLIVGGLAIIAIGYTSFKNRKKEEI